MKVRPLLILIMLTATLTAMAQATHRVTGRVTKANGKPIELATVLLGDGLGCYTDKNGEFSISNVPTGEYQWRVSFIGYQTANGTIRIGAGNNTLNVTLNEGSLNLKGVTVTANQVQMGSKSQIDQQAIRHIQPKSLSDLLQLVPGNLTQNPSLNNLSQAHIRDISGDDNNALGTSVVVDGTPLSNDANMQAMSTSKFGKNSGDTSDGMSEQTTAGRGVDLRTVSPGNVESIEVIRGIPGVEYGNLTSGVVNVKTKSGATPYEAKVQVDAFSKLVYAGKGFKLNGGGAMNVSVDWSQSWADTRQHYLGYDRITASVGYSNNWGPLSMNVRGAFYSNINERKRDPQMDKFETTFKNKNVGTRLSLYGSYKPKKAFITGLDYNAALQMSHQLDQHDTRVLTPDGVIANQTESGLYEAMFKRERYQSYYEIDGKPINVYAQLVAKKYVSIGSRNYSNIKLGAEYTMDGNNGHGLTYDQLNPPQAMSIQTLRPRAYKDIPALHTLSGFLSDKALVHFGTMSAEVEAGVRMSRLFLNADKSGGREGITVTEPRVNASLNILSKENNNLFDRLAITGGFGISNKMPTLLYLYPDNVYYDNVSLNKWGENEGDRLALVTTKVLKETQNPDLKPTNSRKWELGFSFRIGKTKGFLTYFNELHRHEFGFRTMLDWFDYETYDVPSKATDLAFDPASKNVTYKLNGDMVTADRIAKTYINTWSQPSNQTRSKKHGIEYGLDFGEWKALHTSLSINGAWFHVTRTRENVAFDYMGREYEYVALMPAGSGSIRDRVNTTFRFITHIPAVSMIFTTTAQVVWYESAQSTYEDNDGNKLYSSYETQGREYLAVRPLGYYDRQQNYHTWTPECETNAQMARMINRFQVYDFERDVVDPWVMFNFRLTKELGKVAELSFIANNFPGTRKFHTNKHSFSRSQIYPESYFGAELKLKL